MKLRILTFSLTELINAIRDLYIEGSQDLVKRLSQLVPSVLFRLITPNIQLEFWSQGQSNVTNGGYSALPSLAHEQILMYLWEFLTNSRVCPLYGVETFVGCN